MQKSLAFSVVVFLAALALPCVDTFGWISTGHKVVALIAWEDLTPKTKAAVTELLKQHHRYKEDLLQDAPPDETPDQRARTAFANAATWPDMVRSRNNPMSFTHHHPSWHYIDIPFAIKGVKPSPEPTTGPGPHNIVEALTFSTADVTNPKTSAEERAVDLCWIEHLVGDIHQPLHAVSLFSPDLPNGDQGGNALTVLREAAYANTQTNLHLLWDSLPGDFTSEQLCIYEAQGLHADPRYSREKLKDLLTVTDFMAWARESHQLAVEDGYLNGDLKAAIGVRGFGGGGGGGGGGFGSGGGGATTEPTTNPAPENGPRFGRGRRGQNADNIPAVPPGYMEKAEQVAMHQVALAGYRLADELNRIFDPQK